MPGSLLSPPRSRVSRNESTRSDHSDYSNTSQSSAAGKKVSFNKAVRVKKYSRPKKSLSNGDLTANGGGGIVHTNGVTHSSGSPEKRFWFRVYKNKHRHSPDPKELRSNGVIYYDNDPGSHLGRELDGDAISYHPNPSTLNYPLITSECSTQTPPRDLSSGWVANESTPLHPSQMPTEPPHVKRNHVKKIVHRFNEEAVLSKQRSSDGEISPNSSPILSPKYHSTPMKSQRIPTPPPEPPLYYDAKQRQEEPPKSKRNPIVNGVKVIFGMTQLKKKDKNRPTESTTNGKGGSYKFQSTDTSDLHRGLNGKSRIDGDYRTHVTISDGSDTEAKVYRDQDHSTYRQSSHKSNGNHGELVKRHRGGLFRQEHIDNDDNFDDYYYDGNEDSYQRRGKVHVETFDSGNQLVFDTTDVNTASTKLDNGELFCTVGEKHQLWQNNKRVVVYEEPSPRIIRRKAKSHSDLLNSDEEFKTKSKVEKGVSTERLALTSSKRDEIDAPKKNKDSWLKLWRSSTKDKGVQCSKVPTSIYDEDIYAAGKYKVIQPRKVVASAYSDVPPLDKTNRKNNTEYFHDDDYNTSAISSTYQNGDIYSQVDKSKKRRDAKKKNYSESDSYSTGLFKSRSEPLYIGPPPKEIRELRENEQYDDFYEDDGTQTIKTSKRRFGFRLNPGKESTLTKTAPKTRQPVYREENWYDVDEDVEAVEKLKGRGFDHRDISEIREEIANEDYTSDFSSNGETRRNDVGVGSVIREVDYKKREISYENVPRSDGESNGNTSAAAGSGLWFRDADEDYRKEMAQSEVSYPAGNHVGSDRFYTVSRTDRASKQKPPPSPRAYTLDRRHLKEKKKTVPNSSGVKILVNGKEVSEPSKTSSGKKNRLYYRKSRTSEDPSSVQSDPLYVRGGLAAAYQARQRAAVRRSNSSVAGIGGDYRSSPAVRRRHRGTSEASSETESAHARRPLVMYIPGVSHYEKSPEDNDRSSGANVARSQSMMTSTRPAKVSSRSSKSHKGSKADLYRHNKSQIYEEEDIIMPLASDSNKRKPPRVPYDSKKSSDVRRRHSMPKDTKFSWLKWKIRVKPSREP